MQMSRWMCGVSLKDGRTVEELRKLEMNLSQCCCMPFSTILVVNPGSPGLESSVLVSS